MYSTYSTELERARSIHLKYFRYLKHLKILYNVLHFLLKTVLRQDLKRVPTKFVLHLSHNREYYTCIHSSKSKKTLQWISPHDIMIFSLFKHMVNQEGSLARWWCIRAALLMESSSAWNTVTWANSRRFDHLEWSVGGWLHGSSRRGSHVKSIDCRKRLARPTVLKLRSKKERPFTEAAERKQRLRFSMTGKWWVCGGCLHTALA